MTHPSDSQPAAVAADAEASVPVSASTAAAGSGAEIGAGPSRDAQAAEVDPTVGFGAGNPATLRPDNVDALIAAIVEANANGAVLSVGGFGSKRGWGHMDTATTPLCTRALRGIYEYSPDELVLTCGAGTPLSEVTAALDAHGQHLPFAPPAWPLRLNADAPDQTLGGVVASNLAGSARFRRGSARDYLLGFSAVSGRGEAFKAGGKVMKNVTGYDLSKLMCGSFGTLAVLTELSFKVLPQPMARLFAATATDGIEAASQLLAQLRGHPAEIANAWFVPPATLEGWAGAAALGLTRSCVIFELQGPSGGLESRLASIRTRLSEHGWKQPVAVLDSQAAANQSAAMGSAGVTAGNSAQVAAASPSNATPIIGEIFADLAPLLDGSRTDSDHDTAGNAPGTCAGSDLGSDPSRGLGKDTGNGAGNNDSDGRLERHSNGDSIALVRVSATPTEIPRIAATLDALPEAHEARILIDCAGHWLWVRCTANALPPIVAALRAATADAGHVTVVYQPVGVEVPAFTRPPAPLLAIQRQIQRGFDPNGVLAPNRMYPA